MSEAIRQAFHRHLQSRGIPSDLFQRDERGFYEFATVEHDWEVWQAALAAPEAEAVKVGAEEPECDVCHLPPSAHDPIQHWCLNQSFTFPQQREIRVDLRLSMEGDKFVMRFPESISGLAMTKDEASDLMTRIAKGLALATPTPQAAEPVEVEAVSEDTKLLDALTRWDVLDRLDFSGRDREWYALAGNRVWITAPPRQCIDIAIAEADAAIAASPSSAGGA